MSAPPDLRAVCAALNHAGAAYVVIGGFAVIAHEYIRATEDTDLLIPDDEANDARLVSALDRVAATSRSGTAPADALRDREHVRVDTSAGPVDLLREGLAPLDFATVRAAAIVADVEGVAIPFAALASLVAFKRLAGRPRDRNDLAELEAIHGPLPEA